MKTDFNSSFRFQEKTLSKRIDKIDETSFPPFQYVPVK